MPGREPMKHAGQFRLAGTLQAWSQLDEPTGRQRRALWRSYRGLEPRMYGRLGVRSWAAPLPWTTVVVKDPFALLALPTVIATTQARPVSGLPTPGGGACQLPSAGVDAGCGRDRRRRAVIGCARTGRRG